MRGQSQVVGFTLITLIMLALTAIVFIWANPLIQNSKDINDLDRIENRLILLDNAIKEVAIQKSQRTIDFEIISGSLMMENSSTLVYFTNIDLPFASGKKIVVRGSNYTSGGLCLNESINGTIGTDSSSCLLLQGSAIYELYYPVLNDSDDNCFAIRLTGDDTGAGKGKHKIKLKYDHLNTSVENGCTVTSKNFKPTVEISIE
jgi:type II secretory pathway pseudopilin PulG